MLRTRPTKCFVKVRTHAGHEDLARLHGSLNWDRKRVDLESKNGDIVLRMSRSTVDGVRHLKVYDCRDGGFYTILVGEESCGKQNRTVFVARGTIHISQVIWAVHLSDCGRYARVEDLQLRRTIAQVDSRLRVPGSFRGCWKQTRAVEGVDVAMIVLLGASLGEICDEVDSGNLGATTDGGTS